MLSRAVENYEALDPTSQRKLQDAGQQPTINNSFRKGSAAVHAILKPSTETDLNRRRKHALTAHANPLKRSASQLNSTDASYDFTRLTATAKKPDPQMGPGVIEKLHQGVFFDEDDIADDVDLDVQDKISTVIDYPELPSAPQRAEQRQSLSSGSSQPIQYPQLSSKTVLPSHSNQLPSESVVSSSVPLEWSSSPPSHKLPSKNALYAENNAEDVDIQHEQKPVSEADATARPAKRRTHLPWKGEKHLSDTQSWPDGKLKQAPGKAGSSNTKIETREPYTPLPQNTSATSHPWNKTATAIKEEQKKYRQKATQGKKLVKQVQDDGKPVSKKSRDKRVARVFLSDEQKKVLDLVVEGKKSVFFTGSAGTGKSVLMREIITVLRKKYVREPDRVAVTASTGLAACNIGGVTLHSFAGIGLGKETPEELVKKIKRNPKAKNRWLRTRILIIDEISMVDSSLFDKLETIARAIRNNGRPFGGIQLVVTGDFFQLPPVPDFGREAKFAFEATTWATSIQHTIGLTQVFRQKDPAFASMLNEMRIGKLSRESISAFFKLNRKLDMVDDVEATELFPTRNEVDNANNMRMQQLGGRSQTFTAQDGGTITDIAQREKLLANCMAPQSMTLKKGAQVMLIKNLDESLVNGSIGKVIAFMDERTYDHYVEDEDQFQPLDPAENETESFAAARDKLKSMINKDNPASTSQIWPLVRFPLSDGSFRDLLCVRETWKIELPNGEIQAQRSQVPLILAWALSIHKAQGQTLERVKVDLGKIFEKGQAYVALSRATSQEGLQILRFDPKKVMAHDRVRGFYDSLYSVHTAGSNCGNGSTLSRSATLENRTGEELVLDDFAEEQALGEGWA